MKAPAAPMATATALIRTTRLFAVGKSPSLSTPSGSLVEYTLRW